MAASRTASPTVYIPPDADGIARVELTDFGYVMLVLTTGQKVYFSPEDRPQLAALLLHGIASPELESAIRKLAVPDDLAR